MPRLQALYDDYGSDRFVPLAINLWQTWSTILTYTRMYSYPSLRDAGAVWNTYKMNSYIPLNYVIGPNGIVVSSMEGYSEATIRGWIESVLPPVGVSEETGLEPVPTATAFPNPAAGPVTIRFSVPGNRDAEIRVYSSTGRLVRTLDAGPAAQGRVVWDRTDDSGRKVEAGLYFGELVTSAGARQFKLAVLR